MAFYYSYCEDTDWAVIKILLTILAGISSIQKSNNTEAETMLGNRSSHSSQYTRQGGQLTTELRCSVAR